MLITHNLSILRFDETAHVIAHATGCYVRYTDKSLVNVPVQARRVALRGTALRIVRETPT